MARIYQETGSFWTPKSTLKCSIKVESREMRRHTWLVRSFSESISVEGALFITKMKARTP
jgi:hypothetical protein